ncbi:hypothetical protein G6726_01730 [Polynucleobacter paneuropaeus]|nr:hypothetical protein G6726_01730 [Polynucleobacter paneuropaeus]
MTKAIVLTSNSPRHIYFANKVSQYLDVVGIISEPKSEYFEDQIKESQLIRQHFLNLVAYEKKYFGKFLEFPSLPLLSINKKEINKPETIDWARKKEADVVVLFGTEILSEEWLNLYADRIVNLHLGCSPRYRGSATLFWPFFNRELNFVAATIHLAELRVDAGRILKVVTPDIIDGDNYYDTTCKAIKKSIDNFSSVIKDYLKGVVIPIQQSKEDQKYCYRKRDFTEDALRTVMEKYGP